MSFIDELTQKIVAIMDGEVDDYRIIRRPYDQEFAESHGVTLEDIQASRFIPCLGCGCDIVPLHVTAKRRGKPTVYCSERCRISHNKIRFRKITENASVKSYRDDYVRGCFDIQPLNELKRRRTKKRISTLMQLEETNTLLRAILKELQNARPETDSR